MKLNQPATLVQTEGARNDGLNSGYWSSFRLSTTRPISESDLITSISLSTAAASAGRPESTLWTSTTLFLRMSSATEAAAR